MVQPRSLPIVHLADCAADIAACCAAHQQEKQAEKQKAEEPRPLTETQLAWQKLQQERAEEQPARTTQQAVGVAQPAAPVPATPVYTITWQVRLSSLGNIPLPWAVSN